MSASPAHTDIQFIHDDRFLRNNESAGAPLRAFIVMEMCLVPLIIVANIMIILVIVLVTKLHNVDHVYICGVAVADLLIGAVYLPLDVLRQPEETAGLVRGSLGTCVLYHLSTSFNFISLILLLVMCIDRWHEEMIPWHYQEYVTTRRAMCVVCAVFVGVLLYYGILLGTSMQFNESETNIFVKCSRKENLPAWHRDTMVPCVMGVALGLSIIFNVWALNVNKKNSHYHVVSLEDVTILRYKKQGIQISSILTFLFIVLWAPTIILYAVGPMEDTMVNLWIFVFAHVLRASNSLFNFVVYSLTRPLHRTLYCHAIRACVCCEARGMRDSLNDDAAPFPVRQTIYRRRSSSHFQPVESLATTRDDEQGYHSGSKQKHKASLSDRTPRQWSDRVLSSWTSIRSKFKGQRSTATSRTTQTSKTTYTATNY